MQREEPKVINNPWEGTEITVLKGLQGVFFSQGLAVRLKEKYKIVAKKIGLSNSTKNQAEFVEAPFHIDQWAVIYLFASKQLREEEGVRLKITSKEVESKLEEMSKQKQARIFMHLTKEFYLIDGHKFGCAFLAYDQDPETTHAKHLIFIDEESLNHMSRLAGIAKKTGLIAALNEDNTVRLLQVQRLNSRRE